jgi:dipeptidyl aminopeptidase/acylaminoacyl peptidase
MNKFTIQQAVAMPRGAWAPVFSPDGKWLSFVQDVDGKSLQSRPVEICIWDVAAGCVKTHFTGHNACWSPDMQRLAFVRDDQIYLAAADGSNAQSLGAGEAPFWLRHKPGLFYGITYDQKTRIMQVTDTAVALRLVAEIDAYVPWTISPNGEWLAYVHREPTAKRMTGMPDFVVERGDFSGQLELRARHLPTGKTYRGDQFPKGSFIRRMEWSPDNRALAVHWEKVWCAQGTLQREVRIWRPAEETSAAVDLGEGVCTSRPFWSPDGARLALLANPWGEYTPFDTGWLTIYDVTENRMVGQNRDKLIISPFYWLSDGSALCGRVMRHVDEPYVLFSVNGELVRQLAPSGVYSSAAALALDETALAVSARTFSGLNEIWLCPLNGDTPVCITSASAPLQELNLGPVRNIRWQVPEGLEFDGIVINPPNLEATDTPILVFPWVDQGGWAIIDLEPTINLGFLALWFAACGYRVFIPCFRMTGIADLKYTKDNIVTIESAQDIGYGIDALRAELGRQVPVAGFGHSIGASLLCDLLVERPDLVKAAVLSGAYPDNIAMYAHEPVGSSLLRKVFDGLPWEKPAEYIAASPMRDIDCIQSAIFLLMGDLDWCAGAQIYHAALLHAGKDVTYLTFKNQDHWPDDPERVVALVEIALRWLDEKLSKVR